LTTACFAGNMMFYELSMIICRWKHHDVSKFPLGSMYIMIGNCGGRRGWIHKFKWDGNLWKVRQLTGNMYTCMYTSLLTWKKMKLAHFSFSSLVQFFCSLKHSLSLSLSLSSLVPPFSFPAFILVSVLEGPESWHLKAGGPKFHLLN
jgi:hypothetical protein